MVLGTPSSSRPGVVLPLPRLAGPPPAHNQGNGLAPTPAHALSLEVLSKLLWAGLGLNCRGSGGRDPVPHGGWRELEVYVLLPSGCYRYDPTDHTLQMVCPHDARALAGWSGEASPPDLVLVYASKGDLDDDDCEERGRQTTADFVSLAGNIAACCERVGLVSRGHAWIAPQLGTLLRLGPQQRIASTQSVALPRKH